MLSERYSPEDLLADESFINFCKRTSQSDIEKWERYAAESNEQRVQVAAAHTLFTNLFSALANEDLAHQQALLKRKLLAAEAPLSTPVNTMLANSGRRPVLLQFKWSYAAAIVLICISTYFFLSPSKQTAPELTSFAVAHGERKGFQLADGSHVTLNAGSKISIRKDYGTADRDIFLEGEAFFDVKHNSRLPFIVHTPAMNVKAVGTAFNVKAYPGEKLSEAALIRGMVEVTLNKDDGRKLLLQPNQKLQWNDLKAGNLPVRQTQSRAGKDGAAQAIQPLTTTEGGDIKEVAWMANKLIFDNDTFSDIATVFERWYGVKINFVDDDVRNIRFTGTFQKEELKTVLDYWKESKKFSYTILPGNTVTVNISK